jgi:hypothetical protein
MQPSRTRTSKNQLLAFNASDVNETKLSICKILIGDPVKARHNISDLSFTQIVLPAPSLKRLPVILELLSQLATQLSMAVVAMIGLDDHISNVHDMSGRTKDDLPSSSSRIHQCRSS